MGWWDTGNNDDIIGDDPADAIIETLRFHVEMTGKKPTFQDLIDSTADLVHLDGDLFLSDPESAAGKEILAVFEPPAPALRSRPVETNDLTFNLTRVYERIARQYLGTDYERKPRLTELLAALAFVLRVNPERVLSETEGRKLKEFRVEP